MTLETIFTAAADWMRDQDSKAAANSTIGWVKEEWDKVNWAEASARYAQRLEEQHNRFKPLGRSEPIPLGDIFTDVYLLNKISARQWYSLDELKEQFSDRLERRRDPGKRRNGLEVARQRPHLYILGKPGAGKTTFLRYLTVQALRGGLDGAPIFVSLHAWSKSNLGLLEFIDQEFDGCGFPRARPFVDYILQTGRALALFDGLDEVRHDKQDELITALNDFSRRYPTSRMVITCRLAADRYTFENFSDVELADFGPKQIKTFVCHWFRNEPDTAQKFLDELARPDNAGVRELAAVPILLNLLCLAFGDAYHLPSRRSELYGRAIHTLLKYWDDSRNIKRAETEAYELYRNLSADQKKHLIAYIAATTLPGEDYFWPRDRLESGIAQIVSRIAGVGSPIDGGAILRAIAAHHGIFVEQAMDIYSFVHLSFHEYFAAHYYTTTEFVADNLDSLLTPQRITAPHWREVLLLTAEMLPKADEFFALFHRAAAALLSSDPTLAALADWAAGRAANAELGAPPPPNPAALRVFYFLLDLALDRDLDRDDSYDNDYRDRYFALARAIALDRDRDLDLDLDLSLGDGDDDDDDDFDLDPDDICARALALALALARDDTLAHVLGPGPALDWGLTMVRLSGQFFKFFKYYPLFIEIRAEKLASYLAGLAKLSRPLNNRALSAALAGLPVPVNPISPQEWAAFNAALEKLMQTHRDLRHWELTKVQAKQLARYFEANHLLLQCLERADVSDREEIKRGLLLRREDANR